MSNGGYRDLIRSLGFQSFLWTQFLGAFNDNLFKIVLSMIAVNMASDSLGGGGYVSLVGAVFIMPFLLFSGYAGFLADVRNKRGVLIVTKSFEIVAAAFGLVAFWYGRIELMLATLFLMACHSTFFGPAKYGIIPEMLPERQISRANGLLEMSTFLAIILGTSGGTFLFSAWKGSLPLIGFVILAISIAGTLMSFGIPRVREAVGRKSFSFNPLSEIGSGLKRLLEDRLLLSVVGGITYFWFLGSLLQMDILLLGKEVMKLSDLWVGILITFLAIGIGTGSIVAGKLSGDKIEPGLVPLGSIGMGVFSILLAYSPSSYPRTAAALMMLGFSGGFFIVPLNALLQQKSGADEKGRIIGTNNFVNTCGILAASAVLWFLSDILKVPADGIVLFFGCLTLVASVFMMKALPAFLVRFTLWMLTHTIYKIRITGQENVPFRGPALLVCNHMSFVDGLLVGASIQRFVRYMVYRDFFDVKSVGWLLRLMKCIPVPDGNKREILEALKLARKELLEGHVVCIFAEGEISRTGNLLPFKKGFERVAEGLDVPVIPVHLDRVWGSVFSFKGRKFFWKVPSHFPHPVTVSFGEPLPAGAKAPEVRSAVMGLASEAMALRRLPTDTLQTRFLRQAKRRRFSLCMADSTGKSLSWGKALAGGLMLSGWLRRQRPGEAMTAILLPASVGGALSNMGVLFSGGVPVNLNFTAGAGFIDHALKECSIRTIITSRAFLAKAGLSERPEMVFLEDMLGGLGSIDRLKAAFAAFLMPALLLQRLCLKGDCSTEGLATVIFTSGSTGEPKGVMLTHNNIISNIEGFSQILNVTGKDTVLGSLPFFHAFGLTGTLWFPLIDGFKAVYHPNPTDAKTIGELAKAYGATILIGTPTFYSAYIKKCSPEEFGSVRLAIAGAEKLKEPLWRAFKERFGLELYEGYGCTELSPVVSVNVPDVEHKRLKQTGSRPGTVGHPIPGVTVKVVDVDTGEALAPGREGLLLVKGPNVMKGYLNAPDKTASVMRDGWYVTGDIATIGEDGFIRLVDRLSRFSKIAGEMVPHVRIEETASVHIGAEAAVVAVPDSRKGESIFLFHTSPGRTSLEIWRALMDSGMPNLWIPKREHIVYLEEIPLTATGKADLRRLKSLASEAARAHRRPTVTAPV